MAAAFLLALVMAVVQIAAFVVAVLVAIALAARTRQTAVLWLLAVITRRKLPLASELEALGEGMGTSARWRLNAAASRVRAGASLAEALSSTPGLVSDEVVVLAHVGERSDRLGEALASEAARLARLREAAVAPATSPSLVLTYLLAVPLVISTILTGLMIFIVPKYKKILDDFGMQVPWVTEELIASSDFAAKFWSIVVASLVLGAIMATILLILNRVYAWNLHLPRWLQPGGRSRRTSLTLRALAIASAAQKPLTEALDPLANVPRSGFDRWKFDRLRSALRKGGNLWDALAHERFVSPRDAALLAAAERVGNLEWTLEMLADRIDDARRRRMAATLEVVQPAMVVMLGAVVLFVCVGMFAPMIEILRIPG